VTSAGKRGIYIGLDYKKGRGVATSATSSGGRAGANC
jgi:hypothetical protein